MNHTALDSYPATRGNLSGTEVLVRDNLTGLVTSLFVPERFQYRNRSKYMPHQGNREMTRRYFQREVGFLND